MLSLNNKFIKQEKCQKTIGNERNGMEVYCISHAIYHNPAVLYFLSKEQIKKRKVYFN